MKIPLINDPTQETDFDIMESRIQNLERVFFDIVRNNLNDDLVIGAAARATIRSIDDLTDAFSRKYATPYTHKGTKP